MQQAVIIEFNYGLEEDEPFYELVDRLMNRLKDSELGFYDGHEMALDNSEGSFYLYGPDAKKLYELVKKDLETVSFMVGAYITLKFGPPKTGVKAIGFNLNLN